MKYWLWLTNLRGLRNQTRLALLRHFGTPDRVFYADEGEILLVEGMDREQAEAIRAYLAEWGASYCKDIADMLHIGKRTTARILRRMVDRGEIVLLRREKRYTLPKHTA